MLFETEKHLEFNLTYLLLLYNSIKLHIGNYKLIHSFLYYCTHQILNGSIFQSPKFPRLFLPFVFLFLSAIPYAPSFSGETARQQNINVFNLWVSWSFYLHVISDQPMASHSLQTSQRMLKLVGLMAVELSAEHPTQPFFNPILLFCSNIYNSITFIVCFFQGLVGGHSLITLSVPKHSGILLEPLQHRLYMLCQLLAQVMAWTGHLTQSCYVGMHGI